MEGFILECSGKESVVSCRVRLDGIAKTRVGGRDEVGVILSRSVHDLIREQTRHHQQQRE